VGSSLCRLNQLIPVNGTETVAPTARRQQCG